MDDQGNEYLCAYASRIFKGAEIHYGISEKECFSIIFGIINFRIYLCGRKFKLYTDHVALTWLMKIKDPIKNPTVRLARWSIYLQAYDFKIIHKAGRKHSNVDALSRPVIEA